MAMEPDMKMPLLTPKVPSTTNQTLTTHKTSPIPPKREVTRSPPHTQERLNTRRLVNIEEMVMIIRTLTIQV